MKLESDELRDRLLSLSAEGQADHGDSDDVINDFLDALNAGIIRAATPIGDDWHINTWVKEGILIVFRQGRLTDMSHAGHPFFDKHTLPLKPISLDDGVRLVPGGSSIRTGSYVAAGVICMPPMYINIGAYVDAGSMIDSHALVGTCAQIGKRVHVSAAAQIGGVLEPAGARPVIIEDDVLVGGNCGVYEGVRVRRRAVLAGGVVLTASTPLYDVINDTIIRGTRDLPLTVPENAVVVSGSRSIDTPWARQHGLTISTPIIIKYRDHATDARTILEEALR